MPTTTAQRPTGRDADPSRPDSRLAPTPRERRVPWIVLGVLIVVGSGLAFAFWASQVGDRVEALVLARSVGAGDQIEPSDLAVVRVGADTDLPTIPPQRRDDLAGRVATADLDAGTLLTESLLVDDTTLGSDHALVGLTIEQGELPMADLRAGATLLVVKTPTEAAAAELAGVTPPVVWVGEVFSTTAFDDGVEGPAVYLSLRVRTSEAPSVAAAVAQDRVRLVLVSSAADVPGDLLFGDVLTGGTAPDGAPDPSEDAGTEAGA